MTNPQEIIDSAKEGDTVRINLRGPASDVEKEQLKDLYQEQYPGINFIIGDNAAVSSAEIVSEDVGGAT